PPPRRRLLRPRQLRGARARARRVRRRPRGDEHAHRAVGRGVRPRQLVLRRPRGRSLLAPVLLREGDGRAGGRLPPPPRRVRGRAGGALTGGAERLVWGVPSPPRLPYRSCDCPQPP